MAIASGVIAFIYFILFWFPITRNFYKFVCKQQRYKVWAVLSYYLQMYLFLSLLIASNTYYAYAYTRPLGTSLIIPNNLFLAAAVMRYCITIGQS